jgi:hypothetical protein
MTYTMGIDQYGNSYHDLGPHPRKELLRRLGSTQAKKMYQETADGPPVHCGYIIRQHWISLYTVAPLNGTGLRADAEQRYRS